MRSVNPGIFLNHDGLLKRSVQRPAAPERGKFGVEMLREV
jgi:hypothetical protein